MTDENEVFEAWRNATGAEKELLQETLVKLLTRHGFAICSIKLSDRRPDIVNYAILKALTKSDKFRGDAKFSTWFQTVVTNLCNSSLREKKRRSPERYIEDLNESELSQLSNVADISDKLDLERLLTGLTDDDKEFIHMKLSGMTETEIAEVNGLSLGGLRHKWWRIRGRIKRNLGEIRV